MEAKSSIEVFNLKHQGKKALRSSLGRFLRANTRSIWLQTGPERSLGSNEHFGAVRCTLLTSLQAVADWTVMVLSTRRPLKPLLGRFLPLLTGPVRSVIFCLLLSGPRLLLLQTFGPEQFLKKKEQTRQNQRTNRVKKPTEYALE